MFPGYYGGGGGGVTHWTLYGGGGKQALHPFSIALEVLPPNAYCIVLY